MIGRDPQSHIVLDNPGISRCHAELVREEDGFYINDQESANGTFLNDVPVTRSHLKDGDRIRMHRGGIRFEIFGTLNGLTKVSLFKMDGKLKPFAYWHHARNARIADVSAVLLHFPFVASFYAKVAEAVASGRYGYLTSDEYAAYLNGLERSPALQLKLESAKRLHDVDQLADEGFLIVSPAYERFAAGRAASAGCNAVNLGSSDGEDRACPSFPRCR